MCIRRTTLEVLSISEKVYKIPATMGILFALAALLSWGLGDFLIQRSARKFGDWIALFYITAFGSVILFPFVYHDLASAFDSHLVLLLVAGCIILLAALLDFEALRVGKISVIEPVYALEVVITVILSMYVINERLTLLQGILVGSSVIGIFLVSTKSFHHVKNIHLEKGIWYALFASLGMGAVNFLFGLGSRAVSPLMINWFTSTFIAIVAIIYLISTSRFREVVADFKQNKRLIFSVSIFDNLAWIMFSYATLYITIAIATSVSEAYIVFASFLGLYFNREKLTYHQIFGLLLVIISIIALGSITTE